MKRLRRPWLAVTIAAGAALIAAGPASAAAAPDLSVAVRGPVGIGIDAPFTETATVTNHGTAAAPGITVSYSAGVYISPSPTSGDYCTYVLVGHSGRGGGSTVEGMTCSQTLAAGLAPGDSVTVPLTMTEPDVEVLHLAFTVSPYPAVAQLNLVSHTTAASVSVVRPPSAAAPTGITAKQSGDQINVNWTPAPATAPYISSSQITLTPVGSSTAPVLTSTIAGAANSGFAAGVLAATTYAVTVTNNDGGSLGATSQARLMTTGRATTPPGAPTITYAYGYAVVRWSAPSAGNSAIDEYEVLASGGGQTLTSYVAGSTLADYLAPAPADLLTVTVRAHNAAGWGRWSAPVYFSDGGGD